MKKEYKDIAEFGHSLHHLFAKLVDEMHEAMLDTKPYANRLSTVGKRYLHHAKREIRALDGGPGEAITKRDEQVFALAIAMAQSVMAHTYNMHSYGKLSESEIFPVNP
jgi:hypothetical protein